MDRKLRCAVVGAGSFAETCHIPGLQAHPQAEVVVLVGRRRERAEALAAKLGVPEVSTDALAVCARPDIDAISICTPNDAHHAVALAAFAHEKHVFCEKPLGTTLAEAAEMARVARASGRVHEVALTYRFLYGVEELRRRVHAGDVGEPYLFRAHHEFWDGMSAEAPIGWRELQGPAGGGVLWDSGAHLFDLARWLLGPVAAVQATTQRLPRERVESVSGERRAVETDDLAMAWLRFASGARGHWHASKITPTREVAFVQVVGRDGALEAKISRGWADELRAVDAGAREWRSLPLPAEAAAGGPHALRRMMAAFVDACRRGAGGSPAEDAPGAAAATFEDGLAAQRLIDAGARAAAGGWVELAPPA